MTLIISKVVQRGRTVFFSRHRKYYDVLFFFFHYNFFCFRVSNRFFIRVRRRRRRVRALSSKK